MKITYSNQSNPNCGVWLQTVDVLAIMTGETREFAGLAPREFFAELMKNRNLVSEDGQCVMTMPSSLDELYGFYYKFTDPVVVEWIERQSWLMDFSSLVRQSRSQLRAMAENLQRAANGAFTALVAHGEEFSSKEARRMRQRIARLRYKAASVATVLRYRRGEIPMSRPGCSGVELRVLQTLVEHDYEESVNQ